MTQLSFGGFETASALLDGLGEVLVGLSSSVSCDTTVKRDGANNLDGTLIAYEYEDTKGNQ